MSKIKEALTLNRQVLSSYYVAILISFFIFRPAESLVYTWAQWFISAIETFSGYIIAGNGPTWLVLFAVSFFITFLIKNVIVDYLGMSVDDTGGNYGELGFALLLIVGMYIYMMNDVFSAQPMPAEWLPETLITLLGGYNNTYALSLNQADIASQNTWSILPWLWYVGPIAFIYLRILTTRYTEARAEKAKEGK